MRGKMREGVGGRQMLHCMRKGTSVCVVVVVLMVVVGVVELMMVVGVVCLEAVEVDSPGVVDNYVLGEDFVVVVVGEVELVVGCAVKLVLWCSNGRGNLL